MKPMARSIEKSFREVTKLANIELRPGDLRVECLGAPHRPAGLPPGSMAVYVFSFNDRALKVGKAGPNSDARYRSQHYTPRSAASTLAGCILKDGGPVNNPNVDINTVGNWIKQNTERTNFILSSDYGIALLTLLESFIQCVLNPVYEGFASQR